MTNKALASAGLALVLAACSAGIRSAKAFPTGVVFPLKETAGLEYEGHLAWSPEVGGKRLFLVTDRNVVRAFDLAPAGPAWRYDALSELAAAPVLSTAGLVLARPGGRLTCLDPGDGHVLWERTVEADDLAWVVPVREQVILAGKGPRVVSLSASDGSELWRFEAPAGLAGPPLPAEGPPGRLLLFAGDGTLQGLTLEGKRDFTARLGRTLSGEASLEGRFVYFSSLDHFVQCFDLRGRTTRWKVRLAGAASCPPLIRGKRLLLWTDYGVLCCLDKTGGDILWWTSVASRLRFPPIVVEDKVLITASSPVLKSFSLSAGKETGAFDAGRDLEGPPLWVEPLVLVSAYDASTGMGKLMVLKKDVGVRLESSRKPPQAVDEEIVFAVKAVGFFRPTYEFLLVREGGEEAVQQSSEQDVWSWFPDAEGRYIIKVRVTDGRETAEAEMPFRISAAAKKKPPVRKDPGTPTRRG